MAWKCKKCNGEVVGTAEINEVLDFKLDKKGNLSKYDSEQELEKTIIEHSEAENYYCKCCLRSDDDLEEIALWKD